MRVGDMIISILHFICRLLLIESIIEFLGGDYKCH